MTVPDLFVHGFFHGIFPNVQSVLIQTACCIVCQNIVTVYYRLNEVSIANISLGSVQTAIALVI
ncbi:hypothetical protein BMETH_37_4 [methanotrophic bacterial endosymbiont of Bathymodiolus sp.]|nr:hypothetical protein BMETH_37_4 [methanotrophic bacterial endosymbiont of Bathymodiolus sp.]